MTSHSWSDVEPEEPAEGLVAMSRWQSFRIPFSEGNSIRGLTVILPLLLILGCSDSILGTANDESGDLEIISMTADPEIIYVGSTSKVTIKTNMEEGLTYRWWASLGYIIGSGSEVQYSASSCCVGVNSITCTVSDDNGNEVSKSVLVRVR